MSKAFSNLEGKDQVMVRQQQWMHQHSQRKFFSTMPKRTFAALPVKEVALSSRAAALLLAQTFEIVSSSSCPLPSGADPYIAAVFREVNANLDSLIADASVLFAKTGQNLGDCLDWRQETFQAHCVSPTVDQWLAVISKVDNYLKLLDGIFSSSDPSIAGDLDESVLGEAAIAIARDLPRECKRTHDTAIKRGAKA